jgi:hypothetical protein
MDHRELYMILLQNRYPAGWSSPARPRPRERDRGPRLGPNPSKPNQSRTKPNQENGLGFSWIPSSDSELFNGLQAIQRKKFSPAAPPDHAAMG